MRDTKNKQEFMTTKRKKKLGSDDLIVLTKHLVPQLEKGKIYRMGYNCYNIGIFWWEHDCIDEKRGSTMFSELRLRGRFSYDGPNNLSDKGDYLYEFEGVICRGSGAEPVYILSDKVEEKDLPHWDELRK